MRIDDPARPRLVNGRPCWLARPLVAIPGFYVDPLDEDHLRVSVMVPGKVGHGWCFIEIGHGDLPRLLQEWRIDPEVALAFWFDGRVEMVNAKAVADVIEDKTLEDLGL